MLLIDVSLSPTMTVSLSLEPFRVVVARVTAGFPFRASKSPSVQGTPIAARLTRRNTTTGVSGAVECFKGGGAPRCRWVGAQPGSTWVGKGMERT